MSLRQMGMERTPNNSQHTKLTLEKKISRRSCRDSNSPPLDQESGALTNSRLIHKLPYYKTNKQKEVIALDTQGRPEKRPESPVSPPGICVSTGYMNSTTGSFHKRRQNERK